jgi:hypothetical protein
LKNIQKMNIFSKMIRKIIGYKAQKQISYPEQEAKIKERIANQVYKKM